MIEVNIFNRKGTNEDHPNPTKVIVLYSDDYNFMGPKREKVFKPHNGHLRVDWGIYIGSRGFFPNSIQIKGEIDGVRVVQTLPLGSCIVTEHYQEEETGKTSEDDKD